MSLLDCINSAVQQGKINNKEAAEVTAQYNDALRVYVDPGKAKAAVLNGLEALGEAKLRLALITENVRLKGEAVIFGYTNEYGQNDPAEALLSMHWRGRTWGRGVMDADNLQKAILGQAMGEVNAFMTEFRKGWVIGGGLRRKTAAVRAKLDDVGRALYGETVQDPQAKAFADAIETTREKLRVRLTEAGAEIGKLDHYGPGQVWKADALMNYRDRFGEEALIDRILPELDPAKMVDPITGLPMVGDRLRESVREGLRSAMTQGALDDDFLHSGYGEALYKRRGHHRFFHFKDFNAWKRVMGEFGRDDVYSGIEHQLAIMARDIAHMETFGPNPNVLRKYFAHLVKQRLASTPTVDGLLSKSAADLVALSGRLAAQAPTPVAPLITELIQLTRQRIALEQVGPMQVVNQGAVQALNQRILALEDQINPLRWSGVVLSTPDAMHAAKIGDLLDELRNPDTVAGFGRPEQYADKLIRKADVMWEHMRNQLVAPNDVQVSAAFRSFRESPDLARFGRLGAEVVRMPFTAEGQAAIRNFITASLMGAASMSSVLSDPVMSASRRGFLGMARTKSSTWRAILQTMGLFQEMSRADAERAYFLIDAHTTSWNSDARWMGTVDTRNATGYLADRVISASGLSFITAQQKRAFVGDFMAFAADNTSKAWSDLHPWFRDALSHGGIREPEWDQLRSVPLYKPNGRASGLLRPQDIAQHFAPLIGEAGARSLAERYVALINREMNVAVPEGNVYSRSTILGNTKPGTLSGELMRSAAMFKSFPTAVVFGVLGQMWHDLAGPGDKARGARMAGQILLTGTVLGIVTIALKDIKDGRDPRRLFDDKGMPRFDLIGAAMLQAGGLGIYGDFLFSQLNRFGQSPLTTAGGPMLGWLDDWRELTLGNAKRAVDGKPTTLGRDAVKVLRRNSPGLSLWYLSLAYNRMVLDQLQILWDKEAYRSFRQAQNVRRRDYQQDYFWEPGSTWPKRAPDLDVTRRP